MSPRRAAKVTIDRPVKEVFACHGQLQVVVQEDVVGGTDRLVWNDPHEEMGS
jgi:hypothetical protein